MAKYDIYGIGSALVDTEVKVSDRFLQDALIDKGLMTLVDRPRQRDLVLRFEQSEMIQKSGGSACNSVVAAAGLGATTFFSGRVGDDIDGDLYIGDLSDLGVDFSGTRAPNAATGKCLVMVTPDAERTMNTCLGASEELSDKDIDKNALMQSKWLYIEGYLLTDESRANVVLKTVAFARANKIQVALSLSDPFVVASCSEVIYKLIGDGIDFLFCNMAEALAFAGVDNIDDATDAIKLVSKCFAITDGPLGALIYDGDDVFRSPGVKNQAVDTNGAGDMFAGAFLYSIVSGHAFDKSAALANYCAAKVVTVFGPRLERDQFAAIKERFNF
ncbi:MAG: adenosine kinase [Porticoccaceae bacterium]|nr:adenosine kinase [Porticoccaceae bacterium]